MNLVFPTHLKDKGQDGHRLGHVLKKQPRRNPRTIKNYQSMCTDAAMLRLVGAVDHGQRHWQNISLLVRSGQVRYITRPKSRTMRVTRQLMLPPSTRAVT
jgi:hypothetical protein